MLSIVALANVSADTIGRDRNFQDRSWQGDISELIIYNKPLDDATRVSIENILAQKYSASATRARAVPAARAEPGVARAGRLMPPPAVLVPVAGPAEERGPVAELGPVARPGPAAWSMRPRAETLPRLMRPLAVRLRAAPVAQAVQPRARGPGWAAATQAS